MPRLLGSLPKSTAAAVYIPNIDLALADVQWGIDLIRLADPNVAEKTTGEIFARSLGLRASGDEAQRDHEAARYQTWSKLLTPSGLASVGVDVGGSAVIVPDLAGGAVVVAFDLQNRVRFEAWLAEVSGGESRRTELAGEQASVIGPSAEVPMTCLSRKSVAYCQLGAASGADAIAPLRTIVALTQPSLANVPGIVRAFERLPEDAHAFAVVNGEAAGRALSSMAMTRAQLDFRFDPPDVKKRAEQDATAFGQKMKRVSELVEGAAIGIYPRRDAITMRTELSVGERGARLLRELAAPDDTGESIARWTETPALARLLVRVKGSNAERLLEALGAELPPGTLNGTFGLLMLGIDPECPLAKQNAERPGIGWAFLLPSALAVGITGSRAKDGARSLIARELERAGAKPIEETAPAAAEGEPPVDASAAPLRGLAYGSTYEVRVLDDMVIAGTGPGAGAAAMRRLNGLAPVTKTEEREVDRPVLEASVHLRAVDAALGATNFAHEGRRELRMLDAVRVKVRPLLDQLEGLSLEVRAMEPERRMRIDLAVRR